MSEPNHHPERHEVVQTQTKVAYCRCWQSKRFPYCDGSHRELDTQQGPVVVTLGEVKDS